MSELHNNQGQGAGQGGDASRTGSLPSTSGVISSGGDRGGAPVSESEMDAFVSCRPTDRRIELLAILEKYRSSRDSVLEGTALVTKVFDGFGRPGFQLSFVCIGENDSERDIKVFDVSRYSCLARDSGGNITKLKIRGDWDSCEFTRYTHFSQLSDEDKTLCRRNGLLNPDEENTTVSGWVHRVTSEATRREIEHRMLHELRFRQMLLRGGPIASMMRSQGIFHRTSGPHPFP